MPRRPTKVAGGKTAAVPGGISEKAPEPNKGSKAAQKQLAPKRAARLAHSQHFAVNITLTISCNMC